MCLCLTEMMIPCCQFKKQPCFVFHACPDIPPHSELPAAACGCRVLKCGQISALASGFKERLMHSLQTAERSQPKQSRAAVWVKQCIVVNTFCIASIRSVCKSCYGVWKRFDASIRHNHEKIILKKKNFQEFCFGEKVGFHQCIMHN